MAKISIGLLSLCAASLATVACKDDAPKQPSLAPSSPDVSKSIEATKPKEPEEENLASIASGAMIVSTTLPQHDKAWLLLDDDRKSYWQTQPGRHTIVIALAQDTLVERIGFQGSTRHLRVEASKGGPMGVAADAGASGSADAGGMSFAVVADTDLASEEVRRNQSAGDGALQIVPVTDKMTARYLRVTLDGSVEYTLQNELRVYGKRAAEPQLDQDLTGTYAMPGFGDLSLRQTGKTVVACAAQFSLAGAAQGAGVRGSWQQKGSEAKGVFSINVSPDGQRIALIRYLDGATAPNGRFVVAVGPRTAKTAANCAE